MTVSFVSAQTVATTAPKAANAAPVPVEVLGLKENGFDFGKIPQGRPVTHIFEFTNNGKEALKLENVVASCGCTTPEKIVDPILPGATAKLKVQYSAAAAAPFTKDVYVQLSGVTQPKTVQITGEVLTAEAFELYTKEQDKIKQEEKAAKQNKPKEKGNN